MPDKLEGAFSLTTNMLFGKPLSPLSKYAGWLGLRVPRGEIVASCFGKGAAYLPDYGFFRRIPKERVASLEDLQMVSEKRIANAEGVSLRAMAQEMSRLAYFVPTYVEGRNIYVENTFGCIDCMNVRDSFDPFTSKNSAHCFSIMDSEGIFGTYRTVGSKFSVHAYNCVNVQRCFEMDGAKNCSDSYFCHNVESLEHCMFCFSAKSKRYAVGNLEVGRERYMQLKKELLARIVPELEENGKLDLDIYNVLEKCG